MAVLMPSNDDVNMSQSSIGPFQNALYIEAYRKIADPTNPETALLLNTLPGKSIAMVKIVKIGRSHSFDVPRFC